MDSFNDILVRLFEEKVMITSIDHVILLWIENHLRFAWMTPFWKLVTLLGNGGIFWILVCLVMLCMKKTRKAGIVMVIALIVNALLVNVCIKNVVARVRPYDAFDDIIRLIEAQKDYSFPSGHTSASFACAFGMYLGLHKEMKKYSIPFFVIATLVGFSRLYLAVHYPSDVLGGVVIGILSAFVALFLLSKMETYKQNEGNIS